MITVESKINKQIVKNLELEGIQVSKEQQKLILDAINSNKEITNELIRQILFCIAYRHRPRGFYRLKRVL